MLTRRNRVRRVFIVCNHFLRNLAFYRCGWRHYGIGEAPTLSRAENNFWVTINGNFLDTCVHEFFKVFADKKGKHTWRKVITNQDDFERKLLQRLRMTAYEFAVYIENVKTYRDKFLAHLDDELVMYPPKLRPARQAVAFLYDYLLANEDDGNFFTERPQWARRVYLLWMNTGRHVYANESDVSGAPN